MFLILTLLTSCTNIPINTQLDPSWKLPKILSYKRLVRSQTVQKRQYDGFQNQLDVQITKMNQNILTQQLKIRANYLQWDPQEANDEREELLNSIVHKSFFFLSSFVPHRDLNELQTKDLGWSFTLHIDNQKYKGSLKPYNKPHKAKLFYPHHDIWSKSYTLSFDIPTSSTEGTPQKIILTSPYGNAIFHFN